MPWVRASLRGQKVFARADEGGRLAASSGRVEVRYKPNDGRRYDARADNLTILDATPLPDETCGPAESPPPAGAAKAAAAGGGGGGGGKARRGGGAKGAAAAPEPASIPANAIVAYADGACSGNPGPAGLGVVVLDGDERVELSEYLGDGLTNNIAELTAVLRVLAEAPDGSRPLLVHTDSQYTIGVVQKGWKAKANTELVAELRAALAKRTGVRLHYVPGHAGVVLNERADALAREAVRERTTRREVLRVTRPAGAPGT